MAILAPFKGILYNQEKVGDMSLVVTPPYDVITKEDQERYYQRHPYNTIRLILGKDLPGDNDRVNKYTRAANYLDRWLEDDILRMDALPSIYYCRQEFVIKRTEKITRKGFIALVKLENFDSGVVLPHEKTMKGPKADRLKLMESCGANLSSIFSLYSDVGKNIDRIIEEKISTHPFMDLADDVGTRHQLWRVNDKDVIDEVIKEMEGVSLFIADGHHRYETALNYSRKMQKSRGFRGNEAYNYVMMYLSNMHDDGLVILPTHRLLYNLNELNPTTFCQKSEEYFHVDEFEFTNSNESGTRREFFNQLERRGKNRHTFGLYMKGASCYNLLTLKSDELVDSVIMGDVPTVLKRLDVSILQAFILNGILGISDQSMESQKNVDFIEDGDEAIELVNKDKYQLVFFVNPTRVKQVNEAAFAQVRMPQKSTFFYPKLLSGLVLNSIVPPPS